ncbi:GDA1/CD39 (nucleoside phosphatase) family [Musa troglodytarum]|uniref:GDA1/CD39 (Nucleoside phosphatase) family n=1 Tax=Musa troglodytarum TaxID=320322 RepID=A0A9E7KCJ4_9LILI|nr:GDA1/CD39 (nucleoside phosphatase) family [Musa troglodytarum]
MDLSSLQSRASSSSSAGAYFPPHRTQLHPRLYYAPPPPVPRTPPCGGGDRRWILSAGLLILPFLFYLFVAAGRAHLSSHFDAPRPKGFGLVIDAGSSGSRIHVFEFLNEGRIPFVGFDGKGSVSMRVKPGLVAFAAAPEEAGGSILKLLEFAKGRVPRAEWRTTKVQLIENGGLGSFPLRVRTAILESCRQVLRSSGFMFRDDWVSTITGQQKGIYAWIAANYVLGTLGRNPEETMGIIELGGASAQITFVPEEPPPLEYSRMLKLPGVTYNLYSKSIHQAGQDLAWESLTELRNSSIVATGEILQRFKADMQGQQLAFEKFFYISELFGMTPKASLSDVEATGHHYCEDHWVSLKEEHFGIDEMDLKKYCFSSAFMVSLLHDSLGIPMEEKRIGFAVPTGSSPLDWTLGTFILQTVVETESGAETITNIAGSDTLTFISLFAILLLLHLVVGSHVLLVRLGQLKPFAQRNR